MANNTYIIKFANNSSRAKFHKTLQTQVETAGKQIELGEFVPDIIIHDISEQELEKVNRLAGTKARFIADFRHDLFLQK